MNADAISSVIREAHTKGTHFTCHIAFTNGEERKVRASFWNHTKKFSFVMWGGGVNINDGLPADGLAVVGEALIKLGKAAVESGVEG